MTMSNHVTDYTEGDEPVPEETIVMYAHEEGAPEKAYEIVDHYNPASHPRPPATPSLSEAYPDGVAYVLWPVGVPRKFGLRDQMIGWVRRTSFRIRPPEET